MLTNYYFYYKFKYMNLNKFELTLSIVSFIAIIFLFFNQENNMNVDMNLSLIDKGQSFLEGECIAHDHFEQPDLIRIANGKYNFEADKFNYRYDSVYKILEAKEREYVVEYIFVPNKNGKKEIVKKKEEIDFNVVNCDNLIINYEEKFSD